MNNGNPNIQVLKVNETGIFTNYIYKAIPLAFDESMSYYECLCGLLDYLKNTIIPTVNNNADAVSELQTLYEELHDYVEHYFDNLDVQEEINNKLDDMAESGELTDIIAQYLGLAGMITFNNVSEMKEALNLVNGSKCATLGFRSVNDGGKAFYKIRTVTNSDTIDEMSIIALHNNTLIAELVYENELNVKQFGAYGDNSHNDTSVIQHACDKYSNVYIPNGTYLIDADTSINLNDNNTLRLENNAILKAIATSSTHYEVVNVDNAKNVHILGGTIQGERSTHTGDTGEWGMAIAVTGGSENVLIEDITLKDCWGDGLYINIAKNVMTKNIICDNNRRQGLSIISVENYYSLNDKFINTNGTAPQGGVDIEPNNSTDILKNIVFDNPYTYNNAGRGIDVWLFKDISTDVDITINNHKDVQSKHGFTMGKHKNSKGIVINNNPIYLNNVNCGIQLETFLDSNCQLIVNQPTIINCNTEDNTDSTVAGISCYNTSTNTTTVLGNLIINEPYITMYQTSSTRRAMYFRDNHDNTLIPNNISIINPRNRQSNLNINTGGGITNFTFKDDHHYYDFDNNESINISNSNLYSTFKNNNFNVSRILTLGTALPKGNEYTFIRTNPSWNMDVQFPTDQYCRYFDNSNTAPKVRLSIGESVTVKRVTDTEWIVTNVVGSPTLQ